MLGTDYPFPLGDLDAGKTIVESKTLSHDIKVCSPLRNTSYSLLSCSYICNTVQ